MPCDLIETQTALQRPMRRWCTRGAQKAMSQQAVQPTARCEFYGRGRWARTIMTNTARGIAATTLSTCWQSISGWYFLLHVALGSARRAPPRQGALSVTGPFSVSPPSLFLCLKPLPRPPPPPNTHTHTHQDPGASSRLPLPLGSQRAGQRPVKAEKLLLLIVLMSLGVAGLMLYLSSTRRLAVQHGASAGARGWGAEGGGAGVA